MHPKGIDMTVREKHDKLQKMKEREERKQKDFEDEFKKSLLKSPGKAGSSADADNLSGSEAGSPYNKKSIDEKKKNYLTNENVSKAQKSMLELLAVEHVYRNNKNVDINYLRHRAIDPVREHVEPLLKKKGSQSPQSRLASHVTASALASISYPVMVGLSDGHSGAGAALLDKRKLTTHA